MAELTRRGFIKKSSAGAAALGAVAMATQLASAAPKSGDALTAGRSAVALKGPLVADVRNAATGEIAILYGTKEIILHDRELVAKLVKAAL